MIDFEFPIKLLASSGCVCEDCENSPVMRIGEEEYCYECGVPVLALNWHEARVKALKEAERDILNAMFHELSTEEALGSGTRVRRYATPEGKRAIMAVNEVIRALMPGGVMESTLNYLACKVCGCTDIILLSIPDRTCGDCIRKRIADLERQLKLVQGQVEVEESEVAHRERQLAEAQRMARDAMIDKCQAARLREALEFYAYEGNYSDDGVIGFNDRNAYWQEDHGSVARYALAGDGGQEKKNRDEMLAWIEDAYGFIERMCITGSRKDYPDWGKKMLEKAKPWVANAPSQ